MVDCKFEKGKRVGSDDLDSRPYPLSATQRRLSDVGQRTRTIRDESELQDVARNLPGAKVLIPASRGWRGNSYNDGGVKWECQRQCHFRIRLDPNSGCATLVLLVYSFTPARRRQFGVAVTIAAETPRERHD
jgi:hypothetical protein